ncbi:hypothetical protein CC79DRAFT_1326513 [Sarocladium strictum]
MSGKARDVPQNPTNVRDGWSREEKFPTLSNNARPSELASCNLWKSAFRNGFLKWTQKGEAETPMQQLYTLLGSVKDSRDMVNCEAKLNSMKMRVWSYHDPVGKETWKDNFAKLDKASAEGAIAELQLLQGVWQYLGKE